MTGQLGLDGYLGCLQVPEQPCFGDFPAITRRIEFVLDSDLILLEQSVIIDGAYVMMFPSRQDV